MAARNQWYQAPVSVPYGNPNYDRAMGGSHDMDLRVPIDTPITALRPGTVVDVSSPAWGKQVGIKMDKPVGNVPYYAFLHLDAVDPSISAGRHVNTGDLIGWSGGANSLSQIGSVNNPTGTHFLNPGVQSSQPQIGIAMMYGPKYGSQAGWISNPEGHPELNPQQLLSGVQNDPVAAALAGAKAGATAAATSANVAGASSAPLTFGNFFGGNLPGDFWVRAGLVALGAGLIFIGVRALVSGKQSITVNIPGAKKEEEAAA